MRAVVIGSGVFGAWTAHHLLAAGFEVTIVDAYGAGNSRSSSGDESRILRCGYGADEIYSHMARRSLDLWRELDAARGERELPLWHQCGVLWLARDGDQYTRDTLTTLTCNGYAIETLDQAALRRRYPQLSAVDITTALIEPEAGVLSARRAVATLARDLERRGVRTLRAQVLPPGVDGPMQAVRLHDGSELGADAFVFACGPWLPAVFPELLGGRIRPTRQPVVYFGTPAGDARFDAESTPAWVDFPSGIYGVPNIEQRGLKVGLDTHGPSFDPDRDDRVVDAHTIDLARAWLASRLPAMADAPVIESRVCQYENTSTGDFLIDRHPAAPNVWIAGGGSGHGFKHGPAVGERVAHLMIGKAAAEPRFSLAQKGTHAARAVY